MMRLWPAIRLGAVLAALLVASTAACKRQNAAGAAEGDTIMQTSSSSSESPRTWRPAACEMGKEPAFHGKTSEEVVAEIGDPVKKETYKLGERQDEFRIELQNTYPLTEEGNADVEIQEWLWKHESCNLTLWFHAPNGAWSVFETLVWPDDVEF